MTSNEIRERYLKFFEKRGHKIIPSASLVPENDPSSLFTTAGMQPLVPYLLGQKHPAGTRLVNAQKCVRTGDIDDVGDNRHLTFFEMLGNWSLGDYFKKESINWSYEFLTSKEEGLGLDPNRLYFTVFKGEDGIPRDEESIAVWQEVLKKNKLSCDIAGDDEMISVDVRIIPLGKDDNFWIAGTTGPCGADTEMFYDVIGGKLEGKFSDLVKSGRIIEIWNNVFMEFNKTADGQYLPLSQKNVDTGMGLERTAVVMQGKKNVFETDVFSEILKYVKDVSKNYDDRSARVVADHIRSAVFMMADDVTPSNTDRGYVLRRIIRRYVRYADKLGMTHGGTEVCSRYLAKIVINNFRGVYPELSLKEALIFTELAKEETRFRLTLEKGLKEFDKGLDPFILFTTYGFPFELTEELAKEKGIKIDKEKFKKDLEAHQALSRVGSEQKFKGGLGGTGEIETKYHTATHLLHQALRDVLGNNVQQKGSNITAERLRFDFTHPSKMTDEDKKRVEDIVNEKILEKLPMNKVVLSKAEAEKTGALHFFGDKYGDEVSVYYLGDSLETAYSKEFCGGPHIKNTSELGHFKILKEESVSAGIRRIKAVLL
ncbi:MAG: alanine--tRNA ligase [Candidatus Paceibacterota bacterium]